MSQEFLSTANQIKNLSQTPSNDELLKLYALYKQSTVGNNNTPQPGLLDLKGKAKWSHWNSLKGTSQQNAQSQYITFANQLIQKYK